MPELVPRNTSVSNDESRRVSDRMKAARIAGRRRGTRIRTTVRPGEAPHIRADSSSAASMFRKAGTRKMVRSVAQPVTLTKIRPPYEKISSGPVSPSKNGNWRRSRLRDPVGGLSSRAHPSTLPRSGKKNERISRNSSRFRNGQSVRAMIHARTTARASASTARTVDSQTVVHSICQTSGCAMTANEARIDSTEIAPARPGGASRNPASSAVTTGVTVSTATVISRRVGSQGHARTRGHPKTPTLPTPVTAAMSARRVPRGATATPGRLRARGGMGGHFGAPHLIIKELGSDHPLENLGDLTLGLVVTGELELVLTRVVERARGHVGPSRRVAERLHPPLRVLAAQREVDEHPGGVRVRRALDHREQGGLRADTPRLEPQLRDGHGAQAGLHAPRPPEHRVQLTARHLAGLVEAEQLGLEPGELADKALAVVLRVHFLQAVHVVDPYVRDAGIGERHALALDQVDPVGVAHEVPVALRKLLGGHQLGVHVQAADAREDSREVRLLVHDGPAPRHARVERRRRHELFAEPPPREGPTAVPAALVDVRLQAAG